MVEMVKEAVHTGKVVPMRTGHKISLITHMSESKNITLAILFHRNGFQKLHISNLRIYANVLNPFTFTSYEGFDPEWADAQVGDGTGGVSSRTYQVGVNLKF